MHLGDDMNGNNSQNLAHIEGQFVNSKGKQLFEQRWSPLRPKAAVAIVHGYAEHSGRYAHVAEDLGRHEFATFSYDQQSHGRSSGKGTFIQSYEELVDDLGHFLHHIRPDVADLPLFLLGHSVGGLIASLAIVEKQPEIQGAILTGPYVTINQDIPSWLVTLADLIGTVAPKLPTLKLEYRHITRDDDVLARHQSDSLVFKGRMPAITGRELNRAIGQVQQQMGRIQDPLLILHGGDDKIAPVTGSERLYEKAGSADKTLRIYEGLYHEILNEIERDEVLNDIVGWMNQRI